MFSLWQPTAFWAYFEIGSSFNEEPVQQLKEHFRRARSKNVSDVASSAVDLALLEVQIRHVVSAKSVGSSPQCERPNLKSAFQQLEFSEF